MTNTAGAVRKATGRKECDRMGASELLHHRKGGIAGGKHEPHGARERHRL